MAGTKARLWRLILAGTFLIGGSSAAQESATAKGKIQAELCGQRSEALFGAQPIRVGKGASGAAASEPKKLKGAQPKVPAAWPKGCESRVFVHDALIGPSGEVVDVWPIRDSCPGVGKEIVAAIRQWKYEPIRVQGKAVPVCMTTSTIIDVR